ncbi:MAG: hypothetical protein AAF387_13525, partial [Pseudomonadota bacterium]
ATTEGSVAASSCRSPMLYATNIRVACEQYGADGMASLYNSSEFISGLKTQSTEQENSSGEAAKSS